MREDHDSLRLLVAVCTSNRPASLSRLLQSLAGADDPGVPWTVLVVDNPPSPETEEVVRSCGIPAVRVSEQRGSITGARNRALEETLARGAEAMVFVDDDEVVDRRWLVEMWKAHLRNPLDVIVGPVAIELDPDLPDWLERAIGPESRLPDDGMTMHACASNNTLVPAEVIGNFRFDPRFDPSSGEDTDFFRRLSKLGGVDIRVCSAAVVTEPWDGSRANPSFLRARARRGGWIDAFILIDQDGWGSMPTIALSTVKNFAEATMFALAGAMGRDRALFERAAERWNRCVGKLARLAGRPQPRKSDW